jgi:quercetin dioxygenase-like cupin family protein
VRQATKELNENGAPQLISLLAGLKSDQAWSEMDETEVQLGMAQHLVFDLIQKMGEAKSLPLSGGRVTHSIVSFPSLKLFVIYMPAESVWSEHSTFGPLAVQVLRGHIVMKATGMTYDLLAGWGAALGSNVRHDVRALEDSWFLLTVAARTEE